MNAEFFSAIEDIEREKGIPREYMYDKINQAMLAAFRKDNPDAADNVVVELDEEKKKIDMYVVTDVVEEVENPAVQMTLEQAQKISKRAKLGGQIIDPRTGSISIKISSNSEFTDAVLTQNEQIRGEELVEGDRVRVYVVEVRRSTRGPQVLISRTHPGLVKRLFELEVPEIADGTVEIKSIAREAGSRTKMAVWSVEPDVDPIGACVGPRGGRVASIVEELGGEKIDIIKYSESPEEYIAAALAPSEVTEVILGEDGKSCRVIVPDNQLSLAIGKEGQNARLAAKLTGFKIDIKPESEG